MLILGLSLKMLFGLTAKIYALEKFNKTYHRDSQIQIEEFNKEPILALHYKERNNLRSPNNQPQYYRVTLQELSNGRGSVTANWTSVSMLNLRTNQGSNSLIWYAFTFCEANI